MSYVTPSTAVAATTAAKAHVAGLVTLVATAAAPYIVQAASEYLDPTWVANCLSASSLSMLAVGGFAGISAAGVWLATFFKKNKPAA